MQSAENVKIVRNVRFGAKKAVNVIFRSITDLVVLGDRFSDIAIMVKTALYDPKSRSRDDFWNHRK